MRVQRNLIEINGIKYMTPKTAGDLWDMSRQAVVQACKNGYVVGACKDSMDKWIIPVETVRPLNKEDIRQLRGGILTLKNKQMPAVGISLDEAKIVYGYLSDIGLIEMLDELSIDNIKDLVLTEEGMGIATDGKQIIIDWVKTGITVIQLAASVLTIYKGF